jgi:broad specificity phosphatase PhoE
MSLVLVRHGQTEANAGGLLQGRIDLPLNDRGRAQAVALASAVAPLVAAGARVVSSPLARCRETAEAFGAPVEIDEAWIELDYGQYDGVALADVPADEWAAWRRDLGYTPPGGESIEALGRRVRGACLALADAARSADVIVVSHVSPIKAAVAWAIGVGDETSWRMHLDQASITRIDIGPRGPSLRTFNAVAHLGPPG